MVRNLFMRLLLALTLMLSVHLSVAKAAQTGSESPDNRHCFQNFRACRQGCITPETDYFLGGIIDWDTNLCLMDCDLALVGCIAVSIVPLLDD